ncbi:MAG: phytoene/squalene synthase family protein [Puniceicoccales bacterium]
MPLPQHLFQRIPALPVDPLESPQNPPPALHSSFQYCTQVTREHAKSFFFASRFLQSRKRDQAYSVYAYCRHIDDLIDERDPHSPQPTTSALTDENRRIRRGEHPEAFAPAFSWTCKNREIPISLLDDLVEGCCRDRDTVCIETRKDLEEYCYFVASVVGLMMCRVFGVSSIDAYPRAVEMGLAMQLTNILRDIREDFEKDRIYLPADELADRNLSVEQLLETGPNAGWKTYLAEWIQTTREWYASAETGLRYLQDRNSARTARIMGRVYSGILREIEKADYDVRTRHYVPFHKKVRLAFF